jgi:hypothetical protein
VESGVSCFHSLVNIIGIGGVDCSDLLLGTVIDVSVSVNFGAAEMLTYAGSIDVIFWVDEPGTNSLLMKRPVGCLYLTPLGASRLTKRSDIVLKLLCVVVMTRLKVGVESRRGECARVLIEAKYTGGQRVTFGNLEARAVPIFL